MTVSAFWHGIHPGYYLAFLFVPINLVAEDLMAAAFRNNASPQQQIIYDWLCWFFKMRCFDYMCMGFLLLTLHDTLRYWSSIYFIGHIFLVIAISIGLKFKPKGRRRTEKVERGSGDYEREESQQKSQGVKEDWHRKPMNDILIVPNHMYPECESVNSAQLLPMLGSFKWNYWSEKYISTNRAQNDLEYCVVAHKANNQKQTERKLSLYRHTSSEEGSLQILPKNWMIG